MVMAEKRRDLPEGFSAPKPASYLMVRFQVRQGETLTEWKKAIERAADGPIYRCDEKDGGGKIYHAMVATMDRVAFRHRMTAYRGRERVLIRDSDGPA